MKEKITKLLNELTYKWYWETKNKIVFEGEVWIGEINQKGRPINPNSPRQLRLAEQAARKANGETVGRGRPANPESAWFQKQAALAAKREAGELKLGRPVNPTSARQARLAKKGTVPLGRPKAVKVVEETTTAAAE